MPETIQIIGLISAALTTISFLPQAVKTWRTKSTSDLSPLMFSLFVIGVSGWLLYGLLRNDLPIILANIVTLCLALIILFFIIRGNRSVSIAHLAVFVNDLEGMKNFYCRLLGGNASTKYSNDQRQFSSYFIQLNGKTRLELMYAEGRERGTSDQVHVAFSVGSRKEVDRITGVLKSEGLQIIKEPRITGDGYYESVVCDPEGNHIEITV